MDREEFRIDRVAKMDKIAVSLLPEVQDALVGLGNLDSSAVHCTLPENSLVILAGITSIEAGAACILPIELRQRHAPERQERIPVLTHQVDDGHVVGTLDCGRELNRCSDNLEPASCLRLLNHVAPIPDHLVVHVVILDGALTWSHDAG